MADRLLRHIPTGILYAYQDVFAQRPDFEEILDVESRVVEEPAAKKPKAKKVEYKVDNDILGVEASRGLP